MSIANVRIVLVGPLYGGNVGSVCRAMANMGLSDLALVQARNLDMNEARMMAVHAVGVLDGRTEHESLAAATADCGLIIGTSARPGLYRQHARTPREWAPTVREAAVMGRVAYVFGREDKGLSNDELALCAHVVQIPTTDGYTSLNLAQAVMICCYELFLVQGEHVPPTEKSPPVSGATRERLFEIWRALLLEIGFMKSDKADHMMQGFRRIMGRGALTDDDARIMMGIARQTEWAARTGLGRLPPP